LGKESSARVILKCILIQSFEILLKGMAAYLRILGLPKLPAEHSGSIGQMDLLHSTQEREYIPSKNLDLYHFKIRNMNKFLKFIGLFRKRSS